MLIKKSASIFLVEDPCESPWLTCKWLNIEDLDDEHVTGVCALNFYRARQVMNATTIN